MRYHRQPIKQLLKQGVKYVQRRPRARCKVCLKLTIKIAKQTQWHCSAVSVVNFEHVFVVDF